MGQERVSVLIARLPSSKGLPLPECQTEGAAGMDVRAAVVDPVNLSPGDIALVPCGFQIAVPEGHEAQVRPRSGLASECGLTLVNSPGTIDSDYRGEIKIALINHGRHPVLIHRGMRIAQLLVVPVPQVEWREVQELPPTRRACGGFGHTGD